LVKVVPVFGPFLGAPIKAASESLSDSGKDPEDLIKLKSEISKALASLSQYILVIIDDVDRLPSQEILEVIQIVNANADFPNLVYLLIYEREAVEKAIERAYEHRGKDFLEKIIQGSFHVPSLSKREIADAFSAEIDNLVKGTHLENSLDSGRLVKLFYDGLKDYLRNPRHIKRLMSSISFYLGQFSSGSTVEVNVVDLIGLEALRLFEPDIYELLPSYRIFLTEGEDDPEYSKLGFKDVERDQKKTSAFDTLLSLNGRSDSKKECVKTLMRFLFPVPSEQRHRLQESLATLRICRTENFNRYFAFGARANEISAEEIEDFLNSLNDINITGERLKNIYARDGFDELIARLDRFAEVKVENAYNLASALVNFTDSLPEKPAVVFDLSHRIAGFFDSLVESLAERQKDEGVRLSDVASRFLLIRLESHFRPAIVPTFMDSVRTRSTNRKQ
jgi:predicted KAP-like P-loop ATPase